ncbi:MAG: hypothetical protein R3A12_12750 [Ignavibacteria bacterium]
MKQINTILLFVFFLTFTLFSVNDSHSNTYSGYAELPTLNVIPPAYASTPGTATFTGPLASTPRTYQLLINANQLTALVGMSLNAITFRLPVSGTSNCRLVMLLVQIMISISAGVSIRQTGVLHSQKM